jgi:hypothetical protein
MRYIHWTILQALTILPKENITGVHLTELAKSINIPRRHRYFQDIIRLLESQKALTIIREVASAKIVTIDRRKVAQIMKESQVDYGNPFDLVKQYYFQSGLEKFYAI